METPLQVRNDRAPVRTKGQPATVRVPVKEGPHDGAMATKPVAERAEEVHGQFSLLRHVAGDQVKFPNTATDNDLVDEVAEVVALLTIFQVRLDELHRLQGSRTLWLTGAPR